MAGDRDGVTDLALHHQQLERSFDAHGRVIGLDGVIIACTAGAQSAWLGAALSVERASALSDAIARAPRGESPSQEPPAIAACRRVLGPLPCKAGPSYVFTDAAMPPAPSITIERSDAARVSHLRGGNPGNWAALEWDELLDGALGPWTMVVEAGEVASPGPITARGAECGVWTRPGARGRGLAAATAAAWVDLVRAPGRTLFYSTDADNLSSQRVASRLGLRPIGWRWQLGTRRSDGDGAVHPLSRLRHA